MPLDIHMFRKDQGGDPDRIRESQRRRSPNNANANVAIVDEIIEWDNRQRAAQSKLNLQNKKSNQITDQIKHINKQIVSIYIH